MANVFFDYKQAFIDMLGKENVIWYEEQTRKHRKSFFRYIKNKISKV